MLWILCLYAARKSVKSVISSVSKSTRRFLSNESFIHDASVSRYDIRLQSSNVSGGARFSLRQIRLKISNSIPQHIAVRQESLVVILQELVVLDSRLQRLP
jgi:hypothetical protein